MRSKTSLICLPRAPNATRAFAVVKILLLLLFSASVVFEIFWTFWTMYYFRNKIDEGQEIVGRQIQKYKTHRHFFLFTGLYVSAALLIGTWGILKEHANVIMGFVIMTIVSVAFEAVGAYKADEERVIQFKLIGAGYEPVLVLFSLIFMYMIRETERHLASLPIYRQTMAESRRSSFNKDEDEEEKTTTTSPPRASSAVDSSDDNNGKKQLGQVNPALDMANDPDTLNGNGGGADNGQKRSSLPTPEFKSHLEPPSGR